MATTWIDNEIGKKVFDVNGAGNHGTAMTSVNFINTRHDVLVSGDQDLIIEQTNIGDNTRLAKRVLAISIFWLRRAKVNSAVITRTTFDNTILYLPLDQLFKYCSVVLVNDRNFGI